MAWDGNLTPAALPERISHILRPWAAQAPGRVALLDGATSWTYGALAQAVAETKDWLTSIGIRPGDRLMIVGENGRAMIALLLAASELDAWPVPASARLGAQEVAQIRAHSDARRVVYLVAGSRQARAHADDAGATDETTERLGAIALGKLNTMSEPEPVEPDGARQVAVILYTSGTTGGMKGVMLTHRNLLTVARAAAEFRELGVDDRTYAVLPVSHSVGLSAVALSTLAEGATLVTVPRFDPALTMTALRSGGITMLHGVPSMFALLTEYAKQRGMDAVTTTLRFLSVSGAPLDHAVKEAAERLLGVPLRQGYGVTECGPTISMGRIREPNDALSSGWVIPGVEVRLVTADGGEAAPGSVGELRVRGPNVMKGYYRAAAATAEAIDADGWFNTRDLARLHDGKLTIVGRSRELVIRAGINVYPPEVEAVLNAHPGVTQSAVVGRRVPGDEELVAFVQPMAGVMLTADDVAQHAAQHLAPYQLPSEIVLMAALPVSPTGKILKQTLVELAASRRTASV